MLHQSQRCPSAFRYTVRILALGLLALGMMSLVAGASSSRSLRSYLICYRWLTSSQVDPETSWWASKFDFFVSGSTDAYRDVLRTKTAEPMVRYINVNNITRSEPNGQLAGHPDWDALMRWLRVRKVPRERMFYHFAADTICRPYNMSATVDTSTENRFCYVYVEKTKADLTDRAWRGDLPFPALGVAGDSIVLGFDEPFDTVNIKVESPARSWAGRWEYETASGWRPLKVQDGTRGFRHSGPVTFTPPSRWAADASGFYRLRVSCTRASQGPTIGCIRGRDFITLGPDGYLFPGWQPAADLNGDGYVSPAEGKGQAGAARFQYEARVPAFWVGRYVMNVADPLVQEWTMQLAVLAANRIAPPYDGIFVDNGWYALPLDNLRAGGATLEPGDEYTWQQGTMACLDAVRAAVAPGLAILNTGNYTRPIYDQYLQHCDGYLGEFWIRTSREFPPSQFDLTRARDAAGKLGLIHARLDPIDGDVNRGRMLALALYYCLAGDNTYLFVGDNYGAQPYQDANWFPAMDVDLGAPLGDPQNLPGDFPVYRRFFEYGMVVARPLPRWNSNYTDAVYVPLPSGVTFAVLRADGTCGGYVTNTIILRNAEGAVLVPCM